MMSTGAEISFSVYRKNDVDVDRKSTGRDLPRRYARGSFGISSFRAYNHQQYLAKNPDGYFGLGGRGIPFKIAELYGGVQRETRWLASFSTRTLRVAPGRYRMLAALESTGSLPSTAGQDRPR